MNGRSRSVPQRSAAQRARSITSGDGPNPDQPATGSNRAVGQRRVGRSDRHHPAADAPAVQRHAHLRARRDAVGQRRRHEVVELLVQPGDVGHDAGDTDVVGAEHGSCNFVDADEVSGDFVDADDLSGDFVARRHQTPTARMKSSSRLTCSQVNSGSARPKCP